MDKLNLMKALLVDLIEEGVEIDKQIVVDLVDALKQLREFQSYTPNFNLVPEEYKFWALDKFGHAYFYTYNPFIYNSVYPEKQVLDYTYAGELGAIEHTNSLRIRK